MIQRILPALAALAITIEADAASVRVVETGFTLLARPDGMTAGPGAASVTPRPRIGSDAGIGQPLPFLVYPIAGVVGRDLAVPYYVDLDASTVRLDWNCGDLTFNGHAGHDGYIRGFDEQRIGVPVFAPRDGVVLEARDGEPDENTSGDPMPGNYLILDHGNGQTTRFDHLRRDSVPFVAGDRVTAGTQIGLVGSSGQSTAPHVHFEARIDGDVYEPMAGPCRAGASSFTSQHQIEDDPMMLGATMSRESFAGFRAAPWNEAPPTGTFVRGAQTIYFRAEMANVGASTRYRLVLDAPGSGGVLTASSGLLSRYDASLAAIWWGLDVNLDRTGTWQLRLEINERLQYTIPFTVVGSASAVVNRPPAAVTAVIEPVALRSGQVAVCRAGGDLLADPDFDTVAYRYEWRSGGSVVRSVTSAARTDALARQYAVAGAQLSCAVTPTDGSLSGQTTTAYATVAASHRRAARH